MIGTDPFSLGCVQHTDCYGGNQHGFQEVDREHPMAMSDGMRGGPLLSGRNICHRYRHRVSAVETIGSVKKGGDLGTLALGAAVISIVVKEWMFWYTWVVARN